MKNGKQTLVIKLGTSVLTGGSSCLNHAHILEIVRECAPLHKAGHRIVIVTSGGVAAGRETLKNQDFPKAFSSKRLLAAVGQIRLMGFWEKLFSIYGINIGQMLLTRADMEDRERFLNARDTLDALLNNGIIPIINENDAVATEEIKVGDNDNLSSLVAILADADKLLLLTDQEGLFSEDPRKNPDAKLIEEVDEVDDKLREMAGGSVSGLGTGGMMTKLQAAQIANRAGTEVIIAAGSKAGVIGDVVAGRSVGTRFHIPKVPVESRKRWLFGPPPAGDIFIDDGAVEAILKQGKSLLPKGITKVDGDFSRGVVIRIRSSTSGKDIAHGITCYASDGLRRVAGKHSKDIKDILGYDYGKAAIHRDDMIIS